MGTSTHLLERNNMEKPTCPYKVSGICYRDGCIYLPSMDCIKKSELNRRLKYAKKKVVKKNENQRINHPKHN